MTYLELFDYHQALTTSSDLSFTFMGQTSTVNKKKKKTLKKQL